MIVFREKTEGVIFEVKVIPGSSRSMIVGEFGGALKLKVASPPVEGAANAEVIKLLAKAAGVLRSQVEILSGHASKTKRIQINGVTAEQVKDVFGI